MPSTSSASPTFLKCRGATVVLQCAAGLIPLFTSAPGIDRLVLDTGTSSPAVDFHVSMIEVIDVLYGQTGEIHGAVNCFRTGPAI